jgi:hypothetical protein
MPQKTNFKMSKKPTNNSRVHLDILCSHTSFQEKGIIHVECVEKTKKCSMNSPVRASKIVFSTRIYFLRFFLIF